MLIANGTVVTVDADRRVLEPGWVRVDAGEITAVSASGLVGDSGERTIDARGKVVMPGLINAHTHLYQTLIRGLFEGLPFTEWLRRIYHVGLVLEESDVWRSARLGAIESLLSGTTTVVEHHFLNGSEAAPDASISGMREVGVRTVLARTAMDIGELAPAALLETPTAATAAAERLLRRYRDETQGGELTLMVGPNTPGISAGPEMVRAMAEFAAAAGIQQSMHLAESRSTLAAVQQRYGVQGVIRWLDGLGVLGGPILAAHSVHVDADELRTMSETGMAIGHNPVSNLFLGDGIAPIRDALSAGVRVALGTDGAASNNSQDMFEVLKLAGLLQRARHEDPAAVDARQALDLATIEAAGVLGLADRIGSIEVGKRADIVILDLQSSPRTVAVHDVVSQIVHCAAASNVESVLVDGRVLVGRGEVLGIDLARELSEAQRAGALLAKRLS